MTRWLLLLLVTWASSAWGAFEPEGTDWDGLSRLTWALRAAGIQVSTPSTLDFSALPPGSALAIVGPDEPVDGENLMRFVQSGGRLLLADEGAAITPFLRRVGLEAVAPPPPQGDTVGGMEGLRVIPTGGRGPLAAGTAAIVTNHPGALQARRALGPALRFNDGTPFAFHLQVGAGEAVVVADPSVLINNMQPAADNARFAANLGAWLNEGERSVTIIGGGAASTGDFRHGDAPPSAAEAMSTLNLSLAELGALPPDTVLIRLLVAVLLAAGILYVLLVFPGGATRRRAMVEDGQSLAPDAALNGLAGRPGGPAAPEMSSTTANPQEPQRRS